MADVVYVVNNGLDIITNRIIGAGTEPKFVHWGTDGTAATVSDTALGTARGEGIVTGTGTQQTTTTTNDTYQVVGTITCAGSSASIAEVGLFDSSGGGTMFLHGTFTAIPLNVGDSIQFTIKSVLDQV
jgi:hypothetical protein